MSKLDNVKIAALKNILKKNKLNGYIITDFNDLKYFLGSAVAMPGEAVILFHSKGLYMAVRSLYEASFREQFPEIKTEGCDADRAEQIIKQANRLGLKNVAFDSSKEIYAAGKIFAGAGFKEAPGLITALRVSKTEYELKNMRAAAKIAYAAFEHIRKRLKAGVTEMELCAELERFMKHKGASALSFQSIVAFGAGTGNPHYMPGNVKLKKNMPVMFDFGCIYNDYCSDITRTVWYGDKPAPEFKKILKIVREAHDMVAARAKYGMSGAEIDAIARGHIEAAGYGKYFTHRTGHGIGLEPHERGDISQLNKEKIGLNYCFSVEPGIYLLGKFGVRWEDCFYMTESGIKIIN
ncbi:MAG: aminopeptidase P family protein [Elusimicrobiota bacterium]|jgi:Xaa-Pro aminopeptidase|nr:aminopeptidase P family protein [Elusimicrobiota bacterium]